MDDLRPRGSELIEKLKASPECRDLPLDEEPFRTAVETAAFLDGFPRHPKMHPCGVVLSRQPMRELTPTFISNKGWPTTHLDMDAVEAVGLVKMDILAQGGLAVMRDARQSINSKSEDRNPKEIRIGSSRTSTPTRKAWIPAPSCANSLTPCRNPGTASRPRCGLRSQSTREAADHRRMPRRSPPHRLPRPLPPNHLRYSSRRHPRITATTAQTPGRPPRRLRPNATNGPALRCCPGALNHVTSASNLQRLDPAATADRRSAGSSWRPAGSRCTVPGRRSCRGCRGRCSTRCAA